MTGLSGRRVAEPRDEVREIPSPYDFVLRMGGERNRVRATTGLARKVIRPTEPTKVLFLGRLRAWLGICRSVYTMLIEAGFCARTSTPERLLAALVLCLALARPFTALAGQAAGPASEQADIGYRLGPKDVVEISVWGRPELSGKFTLAADGSVSFPLVGSVQAAERTAPELQADLTARLADGFLKNPRVTVGIDQYVSQRVFVMGEVRTPGAVALTGTMTLLEALARAGSLSEQAGGDLVILRAAGDQAVAGPLATGQEGTSEVGRVSVSQLRRGATTTNIHLRSGDTVFVPRAESFYVLGLVNKPGTFTLETGLTVLRAISLAGGTTPLGSMGRVRIVRVVEGQRAESSANLDDLVKPGDTIMVGARRF